jgi:hypothetical protein
VKGTAEITDLISLRSVATLLGTDRKAVAAIVAKLGLPVVRHPSLPNAKLLGPAEVEAVRRALTPRKSA